MFVLTTQVFDVCWPLFTWKFRVSATDDERGISDLFEVLRPGTREADKFSKQKLVDGYLLVAWFVATTWRLHLERAEDKTRYHGYSAVEDDQERFTQLINLRCHVGKCYDGLKRSHLFVTSFLEH